MAEAKAAPAADYRRAGRLHAPWMRRAAQYLPDMSTSGAKPIDISHSHRSQLRLSCVLSRVRPSEAALDVRIRPHAPERKTWRFER